MKINIVNLYKNFARGEAYILKKQNEKTREIKTARGF